MLFASTPLAMHALRLDAVGRLCLLALVSVLAAVWITGCSDDGDGGGVPDGFSLVGDWALTSLEGAPGPVDASNSVWTFRPDGTYSWFFAYPGFFDLQGTGMYTLAGSRLQLSGVVAETVLEALDPSAVTLDGGDDRFSFRDDEGDRWTYERMTP